MKVSEVLDAGRDILRMLDDYSRPPHREMLLDPMVYSYLEGRLGSVTRQHKVWFSGSLRPARIDFRFGTNAPSVLELAVRSPAGGVQLLGRQNRDELRKLVRVPQARARRRYLLLLDLYRNPIPKSQLQPTYGAESSGPGRFRRHAVRVVYVHRALSYTFRWKR